ncbi:Probable RNA-directed DNA polymerase from transposon BS [Eumeta japonica]|uniref:Probable RNA-directed DNA polymerase from transposon BS n=1 Tax=Eumeta variegata TaxID=151549 RepID=A0A4C1VGI3_EUMVA|nr:Probable RNA-directed DNA polymerase from transposon BS [Eumeta japonica]
MRVGATLMEEIKPSHKAFWAVTKALKTEDIPYTPLKNLIIQEAIDDAEIAECLADSIETQCSHASPPRHRSYQSHRGRGSPKLPRTQRRSGSRLTQRSPNASEITYQKAPASMASTSQGNHVTSCQLQTDQPPERSGQTIRKILKTRLSDHLLGKGLIIDEQFGFPQPILCPQQVLRLVEHERTHSTRRLIRAGVPQGSTLSPLLYSAYTNDVPRPSSSGVQLALFADDTALGNRNRSTRFTLLPQRAIDELGQWFRKWRIEVNPKSAAIQFKTVMTYASPVFAHAAQSTIVYRFYRINSVEPQRMHIGHRPKLPYSTRPPLTASGRAGGREPTRDGFLRHPMPRRLPPGVVHSACHAPSALACAVRPHSVKLSKSSDLSSDSSRPTK